MMDEQVKDVTTTALPADAGTNDGTEAKETPPEQTPVEEAFDPKAAYAALEEKLTNMGREFGQTRSLQSKFDKLVSVLEARTSKPENQNQSQTDLLSKYSADQIAESEALIELLWKKKFGSDWERTQSRVQEYEIDRVSNTFDTSARAYAGKDYETLQPLMEKIADAAYKAHKDGNEEASEFVEVMSKYPRAGAKQLVAMAREWHAENTQKKSAQATTTQEQRGAAVAAKAPGGAQRQAGKPDPNTMPIDELRKLVEAGGE